MSLFDFLLHFNCIYIIRVVLDYKLYIYFFLLISETTVRIHHVTWRHIPEYTCLEQYIFRSINFPFASRWRQICSPAHAKRARSEAGCRRGLLCCLRSKQPVLIAEPGCLFAQTSSCSRVLKLTDRVWQNCSAEFQVPIGNLNRTVENTRRRATSVRAVNSCNGTATLREQTYGDAASPCLVL